MALSRITYPGDGVTSTFPVNFALGVLDRADVTCRVGAELDSAGKFKFRNITWLSNNLVRIDGPPPGPGVRVVFDRTVTKNELLVDFEDGAIQTEENLNYSQRHGHMVAHEAYDGRTPAFDLVNANIGDLNVRLLRELFDRRAGDEALSDLIGKRGFVSVVDFASYIAVQLANIDANVKYLRTAGYNFSGDNGGALYRKVDAEPPHAGKVKSADGAWWEIRELAIYPEMFGAIGDGVTDDTAAVQRWINSQGSLYVSGRTYALYNIVNWGIAQRIQGVGFRSVFKIMHAGPGLELRPYPGRNDKRNWAATGISFESTEGVKPLAAIMFRLGRYDLDYPEISEFHLNTPEFSGIRVDPGFQKSFYLHNQFDDGTMRDFTGGLFNMVIEKSWLLAGIDLKDCGDSNKIRDCIISGEGIGVFVRPVTGAALTEIGPGNNITSSGGSFVVTGGFLRSYHAGGAGIDGRGRFDIVEYAALQVKVYNNQMEAVEYDGVWGAMGVFRNVVQYELRQNNMNGHTKTFCLSMQALLSDGIIEGNTMNCDNAHAHLLVGLIGDRNILRSNNFTGGGTAVTPGQSLQPIIFYTAEDSRGMLIGVESDPVTLFNGWTVQDSPLQTIADENGRVSIKGDITGGSTEAGLNICVLPKHARPKKPRMIQATLYNDPTLSRSVAFLNVLPSGELRVMNALPGNTIMNINTTYQK